MLSSVTHAQSLHGITPIFFPCFTPPPGKKKPRTSEKEVTDSQFLLFEEERKVS